MILALGVCAACSTRKLQLGLLDLDGGPVADNRPMVDGGPMADGRDGPSADDATTGPGRDAHESSCVIAAVQLPWTTKLSTPAPLEIVATADAVAVINRQAKQADVRTYARDGTVISGYQFAAEAQVLPYDAHRFLLVARGTNDDFVATTIDPDLQGSTRLATTSADATERLLRAIALSPSTVVAVTDARFINLGIGGFVAWSSVLDQTERDALKTGRIYGMAARSDRVMLAWGASTMLRLAVISAGGDLIARAADASFFGDMGGGYTATAMPFDSGLLLFDGNPVRMTQIGFDLSRQSLGENTQLETFYRTTPQVAPMVFQGRLLAFWLTVFPATDNSQGSTTHQLYGCEVDPAAPATCVRTALIAETGLGGYGIAQQPVAAAAFVGGTTFAVAHTDADGSSWLRIANLGCAVTPPAP